MTRTEELVDWLNVKDSRLLQGQTQTIEALELLLKKKLVPLERLKLLKLFGRIRLEWRLVDPEGNIYSLENERESVPRVWRFGTQANPDALGSVSPGDTEGPGYSFVNSLPVTSAWADLGLLLLSRADRWEVQSIKRCQQCPEKKWFIARRADQRFCSEYCQQWFWADKRKSPEGREREAKRVARWRELQEGKKSKRGKK